MSDAYKSCDHPPTGNLGTLYNDRLTFAPFFSDIDLTSKANNSDPTDGRVYYCKYDENSIEKTPQLVEDTIVEQSSLSSFKPKSTMVVTWNNVSPYPAKIKNDMVNILSIFISHSCLSIVNIFNKPSNASWYHRNGFYLEIVYKI